MPNISVLGCNLPKDYSELKAKFQWLGKIAACAGRLGVIFPVSGSAMAANAPYNIILKTSAGVIQTCATGALTFDKASVGPTYPATGTATAESVVFDGSPAPCLGVNADTTLNSGTLSVQVDNVTLNGQAQGPNVVSISGDLDNGNGNGRYLIHFNANKTFTINHREAPNDPQVGSGIYFIYDVNSIPEPETILLILAGLSALALSRRKRRRIESTGFHSANPSVRVRSYESTVGCWRQILANGLARKVVDPLLDGHAGQRHQQEEQCGDPGRVEQAPEQPDRKKPAGRSEQHAGEPVSPPNRARKMPYQRREQQHES